MDGRPKVGATRDRAVARVVRALGVEANNPAFECHSTRGFPTGAEACVCVWCECLSMPRSETTRTASSALSPVNVGA